jgi:hypothetical protein
MGDTIRKVALANPDNVPAAAVRTRAHAPSSTETTGATWATKQRTRAHAGELPRQSSSSIRSADGGVGSDDTATNRASKVAPVATDAPLAPRPDTFASGGELGMATAALAAARLKPWRQETGIPYVHKYNPPPARTPPQR